MREEAARVEAGGTVFKGASQRVHRILVGIFLLLLVVLVADIVYQRNDTAARATAAVTLALLTLFAVGTFYERKRIERERSDIARDANLDRRIFETSLDLIFVTDRYGNLLRVSPSAFEILGYRPDEMEGKNALKFICLDDLENARNEMRMARRGRQIRNFECRYHHKDGRLIAMNWTGVWSEPEQRHFSIGRDMSVQRALEKAERDTKKMLTAVINASPVAIICLDRQRNVMVWSRAAEQIFGYSADEVIGKPYPLVPPGHEAEFDNLITRSMGGEIQRDIRVQRRRKDGTLVDISFEAAPMYEDGRVTSVAFALTDITERNKLEQRLRQSEKMDAIGQLTGGVAHDFNNMLTVITGTIDLLADGVRDKPELHAIARLISEAADRGAELTGRLLAFARRQPLQPRATNVIEVMRETAVLLRPTLGEQINIEWKLDQTTSPAMVDPGQLVTAILNLAVNARDAMPDGGKLTIEALNVVLDETYSDAHSEVTPGSYVMVAVSDTGPGIPENLRDKVFEPFFTTKAVGKGTGLGLSMVYGFVKQSGGHLKLYSEEGLGTTFKIYLPRANADAAERPADAPPLMGGHETVLVVEDDPIVRTSVTVQLESLGYRVIVTGNAAEALAVMDAGTPFDLLLTDVVMPGMNGRQLADEARRRRPGLKVLFTSGYTDNAIVHHGRLDPGVLLLAKPYRKSEMAQMVRKALAA